MVIDELFAHLRTLPLPAAPLYYLGQPIRVKFPNGDVRRGVVVSVQGSAVLVPASHPVRIHVGPWRYGVAIPVPSSDSDKVRAWDNVKVIEETALLPIIDPNRVDAPPARLPDKSDENYAARVFELERLLGGAG